MRIEAEAATGAECGWNLGGSGAWGTAALAGEGDDGTGEYPEVTTGFDPRRFRT